MGIDLKLQIGMQYTTEAAKLLITNNPVKNSVETRCLICGAKDTYKVSDLKEQKVVACKECKQGIDIGDTVNGLEILKFVIRDNQFMCIVRCIECGKKYYRSVQSIKDKTANCTYCTALKPVPKEKKEKKEKKGIKEVIESKRKKKEEKIIGNIESLEKEPELNISKFNKRGDFLFVGKEYKRSLTGVSVREMLKGQCIKCGSITMGSENDYKKNEYKCKKCEKIGNERKNVVENTNWKGYVRHNIEIIKTHRDASNTLLADTKCLVCGFEMTIPLVVFISEPELTCIKCGDTTVHMECPLCGKSHVKITQRQLYRVREEKVYIECPSNKGEMIPVSEVTLQHEVKAKLANIRRKYKGYELIERLAEHGSTPAIYKFNEHYTGTDGEEYHTCMCETHNKMMVLTDNEMLTYQHEYCADTRMLPYNSQAVVKKSKQSNKRGGSGDE